MNLNIFRHFILYLSIIILPLGMPAQGGADDTVPPPLAAAQQLADHLRELTSLTFSFTQKTQGQMSGRQRQAEGRAFFAKQGGTALMRWNYDTPDRQVILSDGTTLHMYFSSLNQMIVAPAETLQQDVTYSFFSGDGNLEDNFIVSDGRAEQQTEKDSNDLTVIQLIPKAPTSQTQSIRIWLSDNTRIEQLEIRDTFDTITLLTLRDIEENSLTYAGQLLDKTLFQFSPPPETEILYQE